MSEEIKVSKQWIAKEKNDLLNADKRRCRGSKKSRITCNVMASKCPPGNFFRIIHNQNEGELVG